MSSAVLLFQLPISMPDDSLIRFNLELSLIFLAVTLILFLFIISSRFANGFAFVRRRRIEAKVQDFLSAYIFNDIEDKQAVENFRVKFVKRLNSRNIVFENLLALHKSLIGDSANKLRNLYRDLGLHNYSKQKLYSSNWEKISKGIGELAEMDIAEYSPLISTFVNHQHPILRAEAQVAILKLKRTDLFSFLGELDNPLLEWQQQQLSKAVYNAPFSAIPNFKKWLNHKQETVTIFCLRMIAYYGQHNALSEILMLLEHSSADIRAEAIKTLRHLESYEAAPQLLNMFENESIEIQLEILKTLPVIAGKETVPFYEKLLHSSDKRLQLAAAKAMYKSGKEAQIAMDLIKNDTEHHLNALVAYASN